MTPLAKFTAAGPVAPSLPTSTQSSPMRRQKQQQRPTERHRREEEGNEWSRREEDKPTQKRLSWSNKQTVDDNELTFSLIGDEVLFSSRSSVAETLLTSSF